MNKIGTKLVYMQTSCFFTEKLYKKKCLGELNFSGRLIDLNFLKWYNFRYKIMKAGIADDITS